LKNVSRKFTATLIAIGLVGVIAAGASTAIAKPTSGRASIKACALLPDTVSSTRYTLFDAPYLKAAFRNAGIAATVVNAHADPQKQKSQAQQCLAQGAKVILLDQLDATSGASITNLAVSQGAKVIDYDRLVVGSKASYYVSFQNPVVGKLQAKGLIAALKARHQYANHPVIAELNGDIKDNNAKLFKSGYDSILKPLYKSGVFKLAKSGDQWTQWSRCRGHIAEGPRPQVDSAHRPGCDADRRPVHPCRLAERHGLQVRPQGGERGRGRGDRDHQEEAGAGR
jgi:D-xylose transport system substrate-binding protein